MKMSLRKKSIGVSLVVLGLAGLVACAAADQNQITPTGHRHNQANAGCKAAGVSHDDNGNTTGVQNDMGSTKDQALVATDEGGNLVATDPCQSVSKPAANQSTATASAATAPAAATAVKKDASSSGTTTPPTTTKTDTATGAAAGSIAVPAESATAFESAITACTAVDTETVKAGYTLTTSKTLPNEKKKGNFILTSLDFTVNARNTKTQTHGKISGTLAGALTSDADAKAATQLTAQCGGVPQDSDLWIDTKITLPNSINALTGIASQNRFEDIRVTNGRTAADTTRVVKLATMKRKFDAGSTFGTTTKYYTDGKGSVLIYMVVKSSKGDYDYVTDVIGTYELKAP